MTVQWNLMRGNSLLSKDIYVLSVAKSGRTWFRVLLNKYLSLSHDIAFGLEDLHRLDERIPSIFFTHELWEHYSKATAFQRILGKYVIPDRLLLSKKVIVLYRDPRDVLVSLYFQKRKRSENKTGKSIEAFISDRRHGIHLIVQVMNQWRDRLVNHPECVWISYEALKQDTLGSMMEVLKFIDPAGVNEGFAKEAVSFAEFENMKKMEAEGAFGSKILRPGVPTDPDSFKVRKGKVGGYKKHFSEDALKRIDREVGKLHPFFRYHAETA